MKKIFLVLFSLIMMCSVSFGIVANEDYSFNRPSSNTYIENEFSVGTYTHTMIKNIINNYLNDSSNESYIKAYEDLVSEINNQKLKYVLYQGNTGSNYFFITTLPDVEIIVHSISATDYIYHYIGTFGYNDTGASIYPACLFLYETKPISEYVSNGKYGYYVAKPWYDVVSVYDSNTDIYTLVGGGTANWDGTSYFYETIRDAEGGTEENPSVDIPELTDEQIAEIVERFINSDAYLENGYYNGDYFITYDNLTGYFRGYSYSWNIDLAIEYGNYDEEGEFITTGTTEGEAWRIRPYEFSGDIFVKFGDWLASKFNTYSFEYFSISPDSSIEPRYIGSLEHNYCSNYKENEVIIYSSKQIRYVGEETNSEGETETVVTDNYIPPTVLKDSETGEQIVIRDNLQNSSDSLENIITPNADFSGLKEVFDKYISFIDISSITWLTTAISSMITIFVPFVALGIIIFLINRILNGGS